MAKTRLEIIDEVNIRFHDLSPECRRKMVTSLEFMLPYARHTPAFKLGRWSGKMSFCDIGGRSYLNLLDILLPIVQNAGYEVEIDDKRQASEEFEFEEVTEDSYSHICWPEGHPIAGQPIMLKDHQTEVINSYLNNITGVNIAPTGSGKTLITAILSHKVQPYGRSIVIVPTKDLVTQTEEDYINMGLDVGVFFGDRKEYGKTHTICTWQSLESLAKKSKEHDLEIDINAFFEGVVCVIVDECFHPDALVLTSCGYMKISDIKVGDVVINYSENENIFKEDIVEYVHTNLTKSSNEKMYELEFDNSKKIKVTGNHRFLTQRGWVRADRITEEDDIKSINT
jgi:hypothetical protein